MLRLFRSNVTYRKISSEREMSNNIKRRHMQQKYNRDKGKLYISMIVLHHFYIYLYYAITNLLFQISNRSEKNRSKYHLFMRN